MVIDEDKRAESK